MYDHACGQHGGFSRSQGPKHFAGDPKSVPCCAKYGWSYMTAPVSNTVVLNRSRVPEPSRVVTKVRKPCALSFAIRVVIYDRTHGQHGTGGVNRSRVPERSRVPSSLMTADRHGVAL